MKLIALALGVLALGVAGCGGSSSSSTRLDVAAAASLTKAATGYASEFGAANHAKVRIRFGGSDELAAQIRQGVPTDVFLSADQIQPRMLHDQGEVDNPTTFASNRLVLAVPAGGRVKSTADLAESGVKLAIGGRTVPVGEYALYAIRHLPGVNASAVLRNVRSEEPDVKSVVAKVSQGAADAGIVYATDAKAAKGTITAIPIPASAQPRILYDGAVTTHSRHADLARRFIQNLKTGSGHTALMNAGFGSATR